MKLIFMYGPPASGKLTVARELAALTGYRLFHNHLVVDALGAVFEFGSEPFVELRERIWLDILEKAARSGIDGVIFTFAPERSVGQEFVGTLRNNRGKSLWREFVPHRGSSTLVTVGFCWTRLLISLVRHLPTPLVLMCL